VFPQVLPKEEQMKQQAAETSVQDEEAVIRLGRLDLGVYVFFIGVLSSNSLETKTNLVRQTR
jgi:hypothetical protein